MNFKKAYEALKQGAMIKCPEWAGYWKGEDNSIRWKNPRYSRDRER